MKWIIIGALLIGGIALVGAHQDEMDKRDCFKRGGVQVMTDRLHKICISAGGVLKS